MGRLENLPLEPKSVILKEIKSKEKILLNLKKNTMGIFDSSPFCVKIREISRFHQNRSEDRSIEDFQKWCIWWLRWVMGKTLSIRLAF